MCKATLMTAVELDDNLPQNQTLLLSLNSNQQYACRYEYRVHVSDQVVFKYYKTN